MEKNKKAQVEELQIDYYIFKRAVLRMISKNPLHSAAQIHYRLG